MDPEAPSASELQQHPAVLVALAAAWHDSKPGDPNTRHEEGGWIYVNQATGEIKVLRAAPGIRAAIDLSYPPTLADCIVVGKFHTHPNPTSEGWAPGPSASDPSTDERHGVPDLIQADDGVHFSGPDRRRGGLAGPQGYPPES